MIIRPIQIDDLILPSNSKLTISQGEGEGYVQYAVKDGAFIYGKKPRLEAKILTISGFFVEKEICRPNCIIYDRVAFSQKIEKLAQKTTYLYGIRQDNKIFRILVRVAIPSFDENNYSYNGYGFSIQLIGINPYWEDKTNYLYFDKTCGLCLCDEPVKFLGQNFYNFNELCYPLRVLDYPFISKSNSETITQNLYKPPTDQINPSINYILSNSFYLNPNFALNSNYLSIIGNFSFSNTAFVNPISIQINGNNTSQSLTILLNTQDISQHSDGSFVNKLDEIEIYLKITNPQNLTNFQLSLFDSQDNQIIAKKIQNTLVISNNIYQKYQIRLNQFDGINNFDFTSFSKIKIDYQGNSNIFFNGLNLNKAFGYDLTPVSPENIIKSNYTLADTEIIAFFNSTATQKIVSFENTTILLPNQYSLLVIANNKYYFGNSFYSLFEAGHCLNRFNRSVVHCSYKSDKLASVFFRQIELFL